MYAIFETGGKQYTVTAGDVLFIEKLAVDADEKIAFNKVLAINVNGETDFGAPYLDGAAITAKVLKNGKGKKISILTYRSKKDSKKKIGHRQPYTKVEILSVEKVAGKPVEDKTAAPKKAAAPKKPAAKKAAETKVEK